jgi:hypothetical protein
MHIQLVYSYKSFGGVCLLCHLANMVLGFFDPKYGDNLLLRNVENYWRCDNTYYYRGNEFLSKPVRESCLLGHILYISLSTFFAPVSGGDLCM